MKTFAFSLLVLASFNCKNPKTENHQEMAVTEPVQVAVQDGLAKAYFASGCFWCVEAIYESVKGVENVVSGYSGGTTKNPTYKNMGDHAEAIEVTYSPEEVSFAELIEVYFSSQDPTQENGQGPDLGSHYRSIIFYQNETEKQTAQDKKAEWAKKLNAKIASEIKPFKKFYKAEDYHQDFEARNPNHPYILNVSKRRLQRFKQTCPMLIKRDE